MDEDELDPRIQVELEKLNNATDDINKLEIELDEANTTFRMLLNECTRRLKVHSSKYGSAIENARPYYEALDIARRAQQDCQRAAVSFQRANEDHEVAKETVALAERRFLSQQPEWRFDSAWQDSLNHATIKVRDAEKQRAESSAYHNQTTAIYKDAQEKVHLLEQRLRRNVAKSRPYFEEKQRCNEQLAAQKEAVETLAAKVARVKAEYAESLRQLEGISEEIHRKRGNLQLGGCGVREPGVGAELEYKEELEYCARETVFDKSSFSFEGKPEAASLPDISATREAAITDYSEIDLNCLDDAPPDMTVDDDIWLDVDVRKNSFGCQPADVVNELGLGDVPDVSSTRKNSDTHFDITQDFIPDGQTSCGDKNKLSFDNLHEKHFNPTKEIRIEKAGEMDSLVFKEAKIKSISSGVISDNTPTGTETPTCSMLQGINSLHQDIRSRDSTLGHSDGDDEIAVVSVKNLSICVGEEVEQGGEKQPDVFVQENGATCYSNGNFVKTFEEKMRNSDFECDVQAQVSTEVANSLMKTNRPTLVNNENGTDESLDVIEKGHGLDIAEGCGDSLFRGRSRDICAQGETDHGRSDVSLEGLAMTVDKDVPAGGIEPDGSENGLRSGFTFHPGSRPADLELAWTPPTVADDDATRMECVAAETCSDFEASVGSCTNKGN